MLSPENIPTSADWFALQGGLPRIFVSPRGMSYQITHVYGPDFDPGRAERIPHYGCIIPTVADNLLYSLENPTSLTFNNPFIREGVGRIVSIPASLLFSYNGSPRASGPYSRGDNDNKRIKNREEYGVYLKNIKFRKFSERMLEVDPESNGFRLLPLVEPPKLRRGKK